MLLFQWVMKDMVERAPHNLISKYFFIFLISNSLACQARMHQFYELKTVQKEQREGKITCLAYDDGEKDTLRGFSYHTGDTQDTIDKKNNRFSRKHWQYFSIGFDHYVKNFNLGDFNMDIRLGAGLNLRYTKIDEYRELNLNYPTIRFNQDRENIVDVVNGEKSMDINYPMIDLELLFQNQGQFKVSYSFFSAYVQFGYEEDHFYNAFGVGLEFPARDNNNNNNNNNDYKRM